MGDWLRGREQLPGDLNPLNQADKACTQPPAHPLQEVTAQINLQPPRPQPVGSQVVHPTQMDELS